MKLIKQSEDACVHDTISEKHMEFYEENGYLIIKNSISKEKLENFISSALKVFMLQAKKVVIKMIRSKLTLLKIN